MEVLVLCTANRCRSPMAASLLTQHLAWLNVDARVTSAGRGPADIAVPEPVAAALGELGIDVSAHRSRVATREMIEHADLVIGMAGEHVRDAVLLDPDVWARAFTLKELVRLGESLGRRWPDEDVAAWVARVGPGTASTSWDSSDDVADPIGGPARAYRRTASELDALTGRLAELLA